MTRRHLFALAALATAALAGTALAAPRKASPPQPPTSVFVGKLVAVEASPGFWSGVLMAKQNLTYEVVRRVSGAKVPARIVVPFVIVGGVPYVNSKAEMAAEFTKIGAQYTVTVRTWPDYGLLGEAVTRLRK